MKYCKRKIKNPIDNLRYALIFLFALILSLSTINAAGVATSYWEDNPLKLAPGESTTASVRLQSNEGQIKLNAVLDSPIAELVDGPEYTVENGESVPVKIKVSIPKEAQVGTRYNIDISFQEISSGEGGMLRVAQGLTSHIPVEVVGTAESALYGQTNFWSRNIVWIAIGTAAILVGIFVLILLKKKKQNQKTSFRKPRE